MPARISAKKRRRESRQKQEERIDAQVEVQGPDDVDGGVDASAEEKDPKVARREIVDIQSTDELIEEARVYLQDWENRPNSGWKFKKAKQVWILRWMYRSDIVDKDMFKTIVGYLEDMRGQVRERTLTVARNMIEEDDEYFRNGGEESEEKKTVETSTSVGDPDAETHDNEDSGEGSSAPKTEDELRVARELARKLRRNRYKRALKVAKALA